MEEIWNDIAEQCSLYSVQREVILPFKSRPMENKRINDFKK